MKKMKLILLLTLFMSSCGDSSESVSEAINIPLVIIPGSIGEISYKHTREKNGEIKEAKIFALLEILSVTDDNYTATWTTKSVEVGGFTIDETSPQARSLFVGVPFRYVGISDGQPIKIESRQNLIADLKKSPAFKDIDSDIMNQVGNLFESMDEETLAHVFIKAPSFMSVCQETEFVVGEVWETQTETPSPFGEGVILSDVSYRLVSRDKKNSLAKIEYRSSFDSESVTKIALQAIGKLDTENRIPQEEIDALMIDRKDSADCLVDTTNGWVRNMQYSTTAKAEGQIQKEMFDISVKWKN